MSSVAVGDKRILRSIRGEQHVSRCGTCAIIATWRIRAHLIAVIRIQGAFIDICSG